MEPDPLDSWLPTYAWVAGALILAVVVLALLGRWMLGTLGAY